MPESDFTPEEPTSERNRDRTAAHSETQPILQSGLAQSRLVDSLLNSSELQTVLDMLAVMESAEELDQLQALTEAQKRQVWEATSEFLKQKLWQLRNQPDRDRSTSNPDDRQSVEISENEAQEDIQDEYFEGDPAEDYHESESDREADLEDDIEDLGQDLELTTDSYPSTATGLTRAGMADVIQPDLTALPSQTELSPLDRAAPLVAPQVGDRVILKAQPRLSSAELKAVWRLQQIAGNNGEVYDAKLGVRIYPLSWMAVYAKAEPASLEGLLDNSHEGEEDF
ncbi:hypothetical protein [Leptolyngbya ohadii]|uniref:hypothetical protein n=1 Tax=Leptolyngbya ohadii TaxID=1962290 RepID=UPI00117B572D|nr:hypothetical protein [Leptolyngbya ohadii]